MTYHKLTDLNLTKQRVLIREDFNVPMKDGVILDDTRIRAAIPTIKYALDHGAAVILMSHLGRPTEVLAQNTNITETRAQACVPHINITETRAQVCVPYSLQPIAMRLSQLLNKPVKFISDWINGFPINPGEIVLCENVRLLKGEKACDKALSQKMAELCDIFVMDAFATAHRAEASTAGVAKYAKKACAGLLLDAELTALSNALTHPQKPVVAIVGGSKVSTKMQVLESLINKVDVLIVGGGIANTFLAAEGFAVGNSLIEKDWIMPAKKLLKRAADKKVLIPLPIDVAVAKSFSASEKAVIKLINKINSDEMILDVGPQTAETYAEIMKNAKTIIWNGPVGVFEFPEFSKGTKALASAIANSNAFSIAGGGDTLSAIAQFHIAEKISYLSTGGGAFLEWMEGKCLPGVEVLYFDRPVKTSN
ncbi:MAG: phosphoglycerate kinase [Gammaproteobacteria bacterium RIFCSPHIGHO2_12_FULL_38_11]|nr:MAG: phosphoglycerate kinase [Gammaproteobacteria bacterium RIFCSPHIGHO2_12_FULL_38_11]